MMTTFLFLGSQSWLVNNNTCNKSWCSESKTKEHISMKITGKIIGYRMRETQSSENTISSVIKAHKLLQFRWKNLIETLSFPLFKKNKF